MCTRSEVSLGMEERKPASIAIVRVDRTGEHSAPYRKAIWSAMVAYSVVWNALGTVCLMATAACAYRLD